MTQCVGCPLPHPLKECSEDKECPLFDPRCNGCHFAETNCDQDTCWLKSTPV